MESKINIGMKMQDRESSVKALNLILANTYILYLKTQNFHWNVKGELFYSLHLMFEKQYEELGDAADEIAERIRALGYPAPGSFAEFSKIATIKEVKLPNAVGMVKELLHDHELMATLLRKDMKAISDDVTIDLMVQRADAHEKTAWMLRASLIK
jgi:starvation-inducible DNA-binding protein